MKNKIICIIMALVIGVFSLLCYFAPKDEYSLWERRNLAKFPSLSIETVMNGSFMSKFEGYATDKFPLRDTFRRVRAMWDNYVFLKNDTNDLYIDDGYIAKVEYPLKKDSIEHAVSRFEFICENYLSDKNKVYFSVIPDKNYFMAGDKYLSMDYDAFRQQMKEDFDSAEYIEIFDLLSLEDFYKTDTHWRQEAIVDVAEKLCAEMGAEFKNDFTENILEGEFYGVYYGQAAMPVDPDEIKYLTSETIEGCMVYDYENDREGGIYDMEKAEGNDPYEMFLSGPISLMEINNPKAETERELVIFRDSFGSAIAPLMIESYSKITLVDIRYINSNYVGQLLDFGDADVLFLYSTLVLNNSETIK